MHSGALFPAQSRSRLDVAHGVDLVEVARIEAMVGAHGSRFLDRCFTKDEQLYAQSQPRRRFEHLAARFAAKEAGMKALGTGLRDGITWHDFAVERHATGAPHLRVTARAREIAQSLGIQQWVLSLSHTRGLAIASVIALR
ncbi:MAG: holo-ACP synthase [Phycisphaerales bacterium]